MPCLLTGAVLIQTRLATPHLQLLVVLSKVFKLAMKLIKSITQCSRASSRFLRRRRVKTVQRDILGRETEKKQVLFCDENIK
jgi:predicted amidohydrolase